MFRSKNSKSTCGVHKIRCVKYTFVQTRQARRDERADFCKIIEGLHDAVRTHDFVRSCSPFGTAWYGKNHNTLLFWIFFMTGF